MDPRVRPGPASYYEALEARCLMPGWARRQRTIWPSPSPQLMPAVWRFADARAALAQAREFVPMEETERRNLVMVNPAEGNQYATSRNIVAAYQMIAPGERARTHRHSPNALRLVLEAGAGTYTVVDGVRIDMAQGDVVLTPNWCWHGHANDGDQVSYWIDFLDVPLIHHLESMFIEWCPEFYAEPTAADPRSAYRWSVDSFSIDVGAPRRVDIGSTLMKTIGLQYLRMPKGTEEKVLRMTPNNLYAVIDGSLDIEAEGVSKVALTKGDLIHVPCWREHRLSSLQGAVVLRISDEPLLRATGQYRTAKVPMEVAEASGS